MSMISEQVKELKETAEYFEKGDDGRRMLLQAADTIETLSAKLANGNMERSERYYNGRWILCSDKLPDKTGSYLVVTYSSGISAYISDIDYFVHNGMPYGYWINGEDVVAWQSMPEIPDLYKLQ